MAMASFRIHEDQENIHTSELHRNGKENFQQKRNVLGALNVNSSDQTRDSKQSLKSNLIANRENENYQQKKYAPIKQQSVPMVPVAQFEAFKVYEEKTDDKQTEQQPLKERNGLKLQESSNILKERSKPDKNESNNVLKERTVVEITKVQNLESSSNSEAPMSIDKSLELESKPAAITPKNIVRTQRDVIYDCREYRDDIYAYMRECETRHRPKPGYMRKQPDISYSMRTVLIDWLVEVAEEYKLHSETLFLAVSYIDRFLSYMSVVRAKLQLVGTAAMFIASKYEEIYPPDVGEFVYITDDTYSKKQVLRMEHLILKVLSFDLSVPTSLSFVKDFCTVNEMDEKITCLSMYLIELSLLEADPYLQFLPSQIASSAIALARFTLKNDDDDYEAWSNEYEQSTGYSLDSLRPCIAHLYITYLNASNTMQAIPEKYKHQKYHHIGLVLPKDMTDDFVDLSKYADAIQIQQTNHKIQQTAQIEQQQQQQQQQAKN